MKMKKIQIQEKTADKKAIEFFSSLSDPTRLRILLSLTEGPKNVNEIYDYVGKDRITLSGISHQLKQLSDIDMINSTRKGKEKIFQLSNDFCWCIIRDVFKHFNDESLSSMDCCCRPKKKGGKK